MRPSQPDTNPNAGKGSKVTEKGMRIAPTKRFKAKIAAKPNSNEATVQPPTTVSKAPTDLENQTPSEEGTPENKPPPLEDSPIHTGTPRPKAGKMLGNFFKARKDWLIPPNYNNGNNMNTAIATSSKPPIKIAPKPEEQPINSWTAEKCGWGPNCPFCKNIEEEWDGDHHQKQLQQQPQPQVQMPQMQCPQALNYQKPQKSNSKTVNVSDQYPSQLKFCKQWEEEMERLNTKYNLDCFSDSELDSESDEGEEYKYKHNYEILL